jgi:hypothetical protein
MVYKGGKKIKIIAQYDSYLECNISVGKIIYHLTEIHNIESILKNGLKPSKQSKDGIIYNNNRIYFSLIPNYYNREVDKYLQNRMQLEIIYDGSYNLYYDKEYGKLKSYRVFSITDKNIKIKGLSEIQLK